MSSAEQTPHTSSESTPLEHAPSGFSEEAKIFYKSLIKSALNEVAAESLKDTVKEEKPDVKIGLGPGEKPPIAEPDDPSYPRPYPIYDKDGERLIDEKTGKPVQYKVTRPVIEPNYLRSGVTPTPSPNYQMKHPPETDTSRLTAVKQHAVASVLDGKSYMHPARDGRDLTPHSLPEKVIANSSRYVSRSMRRKERFLSEMVASYPTKKDENGREVPDFGLDDPLLSFSEKRQIAKQARRYARLEKRANRQRRRLEAQLPPAVEIKPDISGWSEQHKLAADISPDGGRARLGSELRSATELIALMSQTPGNKVNIDTYIENADDDFSEALLYTKRGDIIYLRGKDMYRLRQEADGKINGEKIRLERPERGRIPDIVIGKQWKPAKSLSVNSAVKSALVKFSYVRKQDAELMDEETPKLAGNPFITAQKAASIIDKLEEDEPTEA
jgi:hypothetical protein